MLLLDWAGRLGKGNFARRLGMAIAEDIGKTEKAMADWIPALKSDSSTSTLKRFFGTLNKERLNVTGIPDKYKKWTSKDWTVLIDERNVAAHHTEEDLAVLLAYPLAMLVHPLFRDL